MIAGFPAALLLDRREPPSRARLLGNAFLLGCGIVTLLLLTMSSAGIAWTRMNVTLAMLAVSAVLWIAAMKVPRPPTSPLPLSWADLGTVIVLAIHGFLAGRRAVGEWDFWAIWGLKGRVFFEHGSIDWTFLRDPLNSFQHPDYPPLMPLNYVFVAVHGGGWNDRWLGLLSTLLAVALALIVRDIAARELPPHLAARLTLGVAAIAATPWIGMGEPPMIVYGAAGLLLVRQGALPAGAILLGLAACSKNEGLALIAATAAALLVAGRWRDIVRLWPAAFVAAPWLLLRAHYAVPGDFRPGGLDLSRIGPILRTIVQHPPDRPFLWAAIAVALAVCVRDLRRERFLLAAIVLQLCSYIGAYLVTPYPVVWHVQFSWPRLIDHVAVPLAFVAFVLVGRRMIRS